MNSSLYAPALTIRQFDWEDLQAVTSLMRQLNYPTTLNVMRERMEAVEASPLYATMIAEVDGEVVGMVNLQQVVSLARRSDPATQVTAIIVAKEHQGQGIGKRLIESAERWAREKGSMTLFLTSGNRVERAPAHAFYEHIGFEKSGYRFFKTLK